jgi:hypothetical protein
MPDTFGSNAGSNLLGCANPGTYDGSVGVAGSVARTESRRVSVRLNERRSS